MPVHAVQERADTLQELYLKAAATKAALRIHQGPYNTATADEAAAASSHADEACAEELTMQDVGPRQIVPALQQIASLRRERDAAAAEVLALLTIKKIS